MLALMEHLVNRIASSQPNENPDSAGLILLPGNRTSTDDGAGPGQAMQTGRGGAWAGPYAKVLFALDLFGASMLAEVVLLLSPAYAICQAFGFERGVSRSFREEPVFQGLFENVRWRGQAPRQRIREKTGGKKPPSAEGEAATIGSLPHHVPPGRVLVPPPLWRPAASEGLVASTG